MNFFRRLAAHVLALVLAACASIQPPGEPEPIPVASDNNAVIALVQNARHEAAAGRLNVAAANLERALRIEPRNATLWHELARINLHQGQPTQAAQFATKSNTFAGDNAKLRASNWRLIGQARTQTGDNTGAESAFERAAQLERGR